MILVAYSLSIVLHNGSNSNLGLYFPPLSISPISYSLTNSFKWSKNRTINHRLVIPAASRAYSSLDIS